MTVTYTSFTGAFPEFSDGTKYPETQVDFWLSQAPNMLNERRLGANFDLATMLFVAHNVAISAKESRLGAQGLAGGSAGIVSAKSVDKVSVSYDTTSTAIAGAGAWNQTSYGQRLYKMFQAAAAGPFYVSGARGGGYRGRA